MKREELEELHYKEKQASAKRVLDAFKLAVRGREISFLDLYPELRPKLKNKEHTNWVSTSSSEFCPVTVQLPFFEKVVLPIPAAPTPEEYEKTHGISVEQTVDLTRKGRIVPLLWFNYTDYAGLKDNYLDPILNKNPPTLSRMDWLDAIITAGNSVQPSDISSMTPGDLLGIVDEAQATQRELFTSIHKRVEPIVDRTYPQWNLRDSCKNIISGSYANLFFRGHPNLADTLLGLVETDPLNAMQALMVYSNFFVLFPQVALDGLISYNKNDLVYAKNSVANIDNARASEINAYVRDNIQRFDPRFFPVELGRVLTKEFHLVSVRDLGFDRIIEICDRTKEPRTALFEIDNAIAAGTLADLRSEEENLGDSFAIINEECNSMIRKKQRIKEGAKTFSVSLGLISGAGLLATSMAGYSGVLPIILAAAGVSSQTLRLLDLKAAEPVLDQVVKFRKPSHVIALYDLSNVIAKNT
jgi:hypothetical protein